MKTRRGIVSSDSPSVPSEDSYVGKGLLTGRVALIPATGGVPML